MTNKPVTRALLTMSLLGLLAGCGGAPSGPSSVTQPKYTTAGFISSAGAIDGSQGVFHAGTAPAVSGGPSVSVTSNANVINGGSNLVRIRSISTFQTIYIYVGSVAGGVSGYWEIRLTAAMTDTSIVVTFVRALPTTQFDCVFGTANGAGSVGAYTDVPTTVLAQANTGEVQVSVAWDALTDVDLHVIEPGGDEIYWADTTSTRGGALDLDSNPGCSIDRVNNENIRWPTGRAPTGSYTVRVDYFSSCGLSQTNYVVTVNNGGVTTTYQGSFTGAGDFGGRGDGRFITAFSHASGAAEIEGWPGVKDLGALFVPRPLNAVNRKHPNRPTTIQGARR